MGEVIPLLRRCPACAGGGEAVAHTVACAMSERGACLCLPDACPLCLGERVVEPRWATLWQLDMRGGLTDGWAAGVRP